MNAIQREAILVYSTPCAGDRLHNIRQDSLVFRIIPVGRSSEIQKGQRVCWKGSAGVQQLGIYWVLPRRGSLLPGCTDFRPLRVREPGLLTASVVRCSAPHAVLWSN